MIHPEVLQLSPDSARHRTQRQCSSPMPGKKWRDAQKWEREAGEDSEVFAWLAGTMRNLVMTCLYPADWLAGLDDGRGSFIFLNLTAFAVLLTLLCA
jgi:hypothetical protein